MEHINPAINALMEVEKLLVNIYSNGLEGFGCGVDPSFPEF